MQYLTDQMHEKQAAYGLLRLVYANRISLHRIDLALLLKFQDKYEHSILRFFKSIGIHDTTLVALLPPTCFVFTKPMIDSLHTGGNMLH